MRVISMLLIVAPAIVELSLIKPGGDSCINEKPCFDNSWATGNFTISATRDNKVYDLTIELKNGKFGPKSKVCHQHGGCCDEKNIAGRYCVVGNLVKDGKKGQIVQVSYVISKDGKLSPNIVVSCKKDCKECPQTTVFTYGAIRVDAHGKPWPVHVVYNITKGATDFKQTTRVYPLYCSSLK